MVKSIQSETEEWFSAQASRNCNNSSRVFDPGKVLLPWIKPPPNWLKCDIGMSWSPLSCSCGVSWLLRDVLGTVLLHGRNSFINIYSLDQAHYHSLVWAINSLSSLHYNGIIFGSSSYDLTSALASSDDWPLLQMFTSDIKIGLLKIPKWRVLYEDISSNIGAFQIAHSVIADNRFQSYIARGSPSWLLSLFQSQAGLS